MLKLHKNIQVQFPDGSLKRVDVEEHGRSGTKSPTTYLVIINGRRLAPIQQDHYGYEITVNGLFSLVYNDDLISGLIDSENHFLKMIPKDNTSGMKYVLVMIGEV